MFQQHFGKYLTMFYAVLDSEHRVLTFSNAGQFPSPILADRHGVRFLEQKSLPVGLFEDSQYQIATAEVGSPFRLALFSDGVLDRLPQINVMSRQEFLLAQVASENVSLEQLELALGWPRAESPSDDLTILLLKTAA